MAFEGAMTEQNVRMRGLTEQPEPALDPAATLDHTLELLKIKDDTARFVGLALLKSILDNQEALRNDPKIILRCWAAVSPTFLDRLLRSTKTHNKTMAEASSMVELAVAVIHVFAVLLPHEVRDAESMTGRLEGLVMALTHSASETTTQILQVLVTIASGQHGAIGVLEVEDLSPLLETASQTPLALEALKYALIHGGTQPDRKRFMKSKLGAIVSTLTLGFRGRDSSFLLNALDEVFARLPSESFPSSTDWLRGLMGLFHTTILTRPTISLRITVVRISVILLRTYPSEFPTMLYDFQPQIEVVEDTKPFAYVFINLLLIDIRSTIPSLLEVLNTTSYQETSNRLAAAYDLVTAFIGSLVEDSEKEDDAATRNDLSLTPDLLLKLRKDIAETMSLTIEYLRDRWDAAISGAAGLHPTARAPTEACSVTTGTPLSLPWDSANGGVSKDPLTLAAVHALALWLREDENESLRSEAAGICDVLLSLFSLGEQDVDFRQPVLTALEGIVATSSGIEAFVAADGWEILFTDLRDIMLSNIDFLRGINIVRVLLTVVESEVTGPSREEWMDVVAFCARLPTPPVNDAPALDMLVSVWQLVVELLAKAPRGLRSRFADQGEEVAQKARELLGGGFEEYAPHVDGIDDGLREVLEGLEGLGIA
ncbi:MAG: hypothetical protein M1835_001290 [Candelina submexicana]|nr:MAG: hypothetical protein M1835_001290 [Candelina submexicana]